MLKYFSSKHNFIALVGLHFTPAAVSSASKMRCIASVKCTLSFEDFIERKEYKIAHINILYKIWVEIMVKIDLHKSYIK